MNKYLILILPAVVISLAFFVLPVAQLIALSEPMNYLAIITNEQYYLSLWSTVVLAVVVTLLTLVIAIVCGLFLTRHEFFGKRFLIAMISFPLAFPGVVIGFFVIMLAGRQGLFAQLGLWMEGERWTFAYSIAGLFVGYLYFSIPRVVLTVMVAAEKLDYSLMEAARSLGAGPLRTFRDVTLPALVPGLISSGSLCFATSMGAFGTAFTLATDLNVLPMTIYTEFTLSANLPMAAALSIVLGAVTWLCLIVAKHYGMAAVSMGA
ncbi:ABC transporter permease [Vibrio sp. SCSIO 43132]|uniref:ABC transporter permease n=1 Tax=Vibrio sp. SCSIO 43132 TaxID=2779363 RepID=UPI001CAA262B|nr:ABC transporter permease [Vibrio sp. SCSIO 43132]UAB73756.1 ABC transporter permease [Vibrio sp. SCSIO 43132]